MPLKRYSAAQRGYDARWRRARALFLAKNPICQICFETRHKIIPATVVDHRIPHRGDPKTFWDQTGWQSVCLSCHQSKSGQEAHTDHARIKGCDAQGMPLDPTHPWRRA